MRRTQSVVNLDPIDRNNRRRSGPIGRFMKTRRFKGQPMKRTDPFGHWLYVGRQREGKTSSAVFTLDYLDKKYRRKGYKVVILTNMGFGIPVRKSTFPDQIQQCEYQPKTVYLFLIDEIQSWYPKDTKDQATLEQIDRLTGQFSQLGKRQIYVLSTAQIYGRVHKNLREQCLYMINCRPSAFRNKCVNDFILGDDVLCDDLGRWSGEPFKIWIHGLPTRKFDTHRMIVSD